MAKFLTVPIKKKRKNTQITNPRIEKESTIIQRTKRDYYEFYAPKFV